MNTNTKGITQFFVMYFLICIVITCAFVACKYVHDQRKAADESYNKPQLVVGRDDAKIHQECDQEMQEQSSIIDSLYERTIELETIVAGYEHQDHSRLVAN